MRLAAGAMAMMAMTGCMTPPEAAAGEIRPRGTGAVCDAAPAKALVGRARSQALGKQALKLTGAAKLRWIEPGMMVTMDYREDRLNVHVDAKGKVLRLACG